MDRYAKLSVGWNYLSISKFQRLHCGNLGMNKQFYPTDYDGCNYIFMPALNLIHVIPQRNFIMLTLLSPLLLEVILRITSNANSDDTCDTMAINSLQCVADSIRRSHYGDVIMSAIASQITSLTIVYSTVYWGADQRKHQSSASLASVRNSPVTEEFPEQKANNAENVSVWRRHHGYDNFPSAITI